MLRLRGFVREVVGIAWPLVVGQVVEGIYSVVDVFFVSRLGTVAVAALGLGAYMSWLLFVVVALFSTGCMVLASQCYGARDRECVKRVLGVGLALGVIASLAISIPGYLAANALARVVGGSSRELVEEAAKYFRVRVLGLPASVSAMVLDSGLRAVGATRLSMYALVSSVALNIALDPILIFGLLGAPRMGVEGAALALVISVAYMIPVDVAFLARLGLAPKPCLDLDLAKRVVALGGPAAIERLVFAIGNNAYVALISRCGSQALAAHQIGLRIEGFVYLPGFAFSVAAAALVGQRVGAKNIEEGKGVGLEAAKVGTLVMTATGIGLALAAPIVVKPFATSPEVARLATIYLVLAGLSEPGLALAMILSNAIRGAGNTLVPMIVNAAGLYLFRLLPASILTKSMGVVGAWIAMFVDVYARGTTFLALYLRKFSKLAKRVTPGERSRAS